MLRVYAFVDGGYLRQGLGTISVAWQELNVRELAHAARGMVRDRWQGETMQVGRVFVYDAVPEGADEEDEVERWLRRNGRELDVHIRRGLVVGTPPRQKGVDIKLAVDALSMAAKGVYDCALLFAGDGDFVPIVEAVRSEGPLVAVCCFRNSISRQLKNEADRVGYLPGDSSSWDAWKLPD